MSTLSMHPTEYAEERKVALGFWVYLMSDCLLFASLFASFAVLRNSTFGGPSGAELFDLPFVFKETLILLTSSFASGLGLLSAKRGNKVRTIAWFAVTAFLGAEFLVLEMREFSGLVDAGNGWQRSGFLSAFFTLVATHGAHVAAGLIAMSVLVVQVAMRGISTVTLRRLTCVSLFWHFLDIVWIFIFSVVYLMSFI